MTWTQGQLVWCHGNIGEISKVHVEDRLLAIRGKTNPWPLDACVPINKTTNNWKNFTRGQEIYVGINAIPHTIFGWSMESDRIIVTVPDCSDCYEMMNAEDAGVTVRDAKRHAWFQQWTPNEPSVTKTQYERWKREEDGDMLTIYWEYIASRRRLSDTESIQMAASWRKSSDPIEGPLQGLRVYQFIRQKWPEQEPWVLAGEGGCYRTLQRFDSAKAIYQNLKDHYPDTDHQVAAALGMSGVYGEEDQPQLASEWYKRAKDLDPNVAPRSVSPKRHRSQKPPMNQVTIERLVANVEAHGDIPSVAALMGMTPKAR